MCCASAIIIHLITGEQLWVSARVGREATPCPRYLSQKSPLQQLSRVLAKHIWGYEVSTENGPVKKPTTLAKKSFTSGLKCNHRFGPTVGQVKLMELTAAK